MLRLIQLLSCLIAVVVSQCPNNCSGHGSCAGSTCTCVSGFSGSDCSEYQCASSLNGCSGHGQCRGNQCVCHDGFGGYDCSGITTNCTNFCSAHGSCLNGICTCDTGYVGTDCSTVDASISCPQNCSGHGFCDTSSSPPTCVCMPGWFGNKCDVEQFSCPSSLNNCTGHGICGPSNVTDPSSSWQCACEEGFCGTSCNRVCPSCPNNCTGHGICVGSTCICDSGFTSSDCSVVTAIPGCPNNCSGHGRCLQGSNAAYSCVCSAGFNGSACSAVSGGCPGNCSGKGECVNGRCRCMAGFNGTACQQALGTCAASNFCSQNGVCINGLCSCYPGFSGYDCSEACYPNSTGNISCNSDKGHGVCMNGTCVCKEGEWMGNYCQTPVHDTTLGSVTSANNPIGVIALSCVGAAVVFIVGGVGYNKYKGKKGLKALPFTSSDEIAVPFKGDDYDAAPDNRFASNY